jgi:hypothetical protein
MVALTGGDMRKLDDIPTPVIDSEIELGE